MGRFNYYAVYKGYDDVNGTPVSKEIFESWDECKPYINKMIGARYKGFATIDDCEKWFNKLDSDSSKDESDNPAIHESNDYAQEMDIVDLEFKRLCNALNVDPYAIESAFKAGFCAAHRFTKNNATNSMAPIGAMSGGKNDEAKGT